MTTLSIIEDVAEAEWPARPIGLSAAAAAIEAEVIWRRLESVGLKHCFPTWIVDWALLGIAESRGAALAGRAAAAVARSVVARISLFISGLPGYGHPLSVDVHWWAEPAFGFTGKKSRSGKRLACR